MSDKNVIQHEVSVIATVHGFHFKTKDYPVQILRSIIESFKPELILVEIRPEAFAKNEYEDGPIEMTYLTAVAKDMGIPIQAIDWWREKDLDIEPAKLSEIEQKTYDDEIFKIGPAESWYTNFSYDLVNSKDFQNKVLRSKTINTQWQQDPAWAIRQSHFNENCFKAIRDSQSRKTLIFVGAEHKAELDAYLSQWNQLKHFSASNYSHLAKKQMTLKLEDCFKEELHKSKLRIQKKLETPLTQKSHQYLSAKLNQIEFVLNSEWF